MSEVKSIAYLSPDTVAEMKERIKLLGSSIALLTEFMNYEQQTGGENWKAKVNAMKMMRDTYHLRQQAIKDVLQAHGSGLGFIYTDPRGTKHEFW